MGVTQYLREAWKKPDTEILRNRMIGWRKEPVVLRIENPTRLDRAHSLGYKAKNGFIIARVRVLRGGRQRQKFKGGRKSSKMRRTKIVGMSYQWIAEQRANKRFKNMSTLNSYWVGQDGKHYWYEVILVDPCAPEIKADKNINWICTAKHRTRVYRGKTSAGRKSRALAGTGKGYEKSRPSLRAHKDRAK